ncbi:hypothetical protein ZIOFF_006056 [Zingiber officinale]|uniref:Uncharacterized protein n=1 Tax=Zingiber officinale TaxID=94328 RepID=A0A8J5HV31_ZINOF|nr:hypothetical protein ZIOFF_006056 [Zingiber officinale]
MVARHSTSDPPVITITRRTATEAAPLFEDQIRSYRQGQQRRYNIPGAVSSSWKSANSVTSEVVNYIFYFICKSNITRGLVGRLSNTPNAGFAYEVENVVDYLASHGVRALPGRRYSTRDVLGQNWIIRQSVINIPMQPTEVNTRNLLYFLRCP